SFDRGRSYARSGRVVKIAWDPEGETLSGSVVGHGPLYETAAYFAGEGDGALAFQDGECTCPVGYNCKHVAAIVIAATDGRGRLATGARSARRSGTVAQQRSWEQPLRALIEAPAAQAAGNPLALELALRANGVAP